uniref:Serine/arginine repetitive matrix protein 2 n=1 Tax=Mesocestoides corti TaxID=53468 RepID=A0A5K3FDN8_MESCO
MANIGRTQNLNSIIPRRPLYRTLEDFYIDGPLPQRHAHGHASRQLGSRHGHQYRDSHSKYGGSSSSRGSSSSSFTTDSSLMSKCKHKRRQSVPFHGHQTPPRQGSRHYNIDRMLASDPYYEQAFQHKYHNLDYKNNTRQVNEGIPVVYGSNFGSNQQEKSKLQQRKTSEFRKTDARSPRKCQNKKKHHKSSSESSQSSRSSSTSSSQSSLKSEEKQPKKQPKSRNQQTKRNPKILPEPKSHHRRPSQSEFSDLSETSSSGSKNKVVYRKCQKCGKKSPKPEKKDWSKEKSHQKHRFKGNEFHHLDVMAGLR